MRVTIVLVWVVKEQKYHNLTIFISKIARFWQTCSNYSRFQGFGRIPTYTISYLTYQGIMVYRWLCCQIPGRLFFKPNCFFENTAFIQKVANFCAFKKSAFTNRSGFISNDSHCSKKNLVSCLPADSRHSSVRSSRSS